MRGLFSLNVDTFKLFSLSEILLNSVLIIGSVGAITGCIGFIIAWLLGRYEFFGRRLFEILVLLPLSIPTYVMGFIWIGLLDYSGPVSTSLRNAGIMSQIPVKSLSGIIWVMCLCFTPYVVLFCRQALSCLTQRHIEAAQSLGINRLQLITRVILPHCWPWIMGAMGIVAMEVLADFGTVSLFNLNMLTTAIYKAWYGYYNFEQALALTSLLMGGVIIFSILKRRTIYYNDSKIKIKRIRLNKAKSSIVVIGLSLWLLLSYFIPLIKLIHWSIGGWLTKIYIPQWGGIIATTLQLSLGSVCIILGTGTLLLFWDRIAPSRPLKLTLFLTKLGYAFPGTVLAVICYWIFYKVGLGFPLLILFVGYWIRFFIVFANGMTPAIALINQNILQSAQLLGAKSTRLFREIYLPTITPALMYSGALVFVEVAKELPLTLMTRPFGWDTLAIKVFEYSAEGHWQLAALPALMLTVIGFVPMLWLSKTQG